MEKKSKRRLFAIFLLMGVLTLTGRAAAGPAQVGPRFEIFRGLSHEGKPSVTFDRVNQRFLVVWTDDQAIPGSYYFDHWIKGQLVNADGSMYGNTLSISDPIAGITSMSQGNGFKTIAFNPVDQQFATVWTDSRGGARIYLQLINADGSLYGPNTDISSRRPGDEGAFNPGVIYVPANNNYFIVYGLQFGEALLGQFVTADGAVNGGQLTITTGSDYSVGEYNISFDPASGRILITWVNLNDAKVYGRLLNADGSFHGPELEIAPANKYGALMDLANDPDHGRFLLVLDLISSWGGVWSQLITADGNLIGTPRLLFPDPYFNIYDGPALTFDQAHKKFLIAVSLGCDIYGQYLHTDGTWFGGVFTIAKTGGTGNFPALAFGTAPSGSLVVWSDGKLIYGALVKAPPNFLPALLPLLLGD